MSWVGGADFDNLYDNEWCKNENIVVVFDAVDMSTSFSIAVPREHFEQNCLSLFDKENSWHIPYKEYKADNFGSFANIVRDV